MLQKSKYVIMEIVKSDSPVIELVPIVFPASLVHRGVYTGARPAYEDTCNLTSIRPYSAGFLDIRIKNNIHSNMKPILEIKTFGKSVSLNIESREGDEELIAKMLNGERITILKPQ